MSGGRYDVVFLDLDGTVFDFDRAQAAALGQTLTAHGLPDSDVVASRYRAINDAVWSEFERGEIEQSAIRAERFRRLLSELQQSGDAAAMGEDYLATLGQQGHCLDGALDVVQVLAKCVRIVAVTNGIPDVQHPRIERSGLSQFLLARVISGEVGVAKPHAGIFDAAMQAARDPDPARVLMVGDSLRSDIRGAVDYGIDSCWFDPAQRGRSDGDESAEATHVIATLSELVDLVGA